MCIAIYLPQGKEIERNVLKECDKSNPHGFGYAYFDEFGNLQIHKTVKNVKKNIGYFLKIRKANIDKPFILHFRIATHGKIIKTCCHPFKVNDNLVFCHNGILDGKYTSGLSMLDNQSDSMKFGSEMLANLPADFMENEKIKELLNDHIGSGNKMILLNKDGKHWILNENKGVWDNGIWFSNHSYKKIEFTHYKGWDKENNLFTYGSYYSKWHEDETTPVHPYKNKTFATPEDSKLIQDIIKSDKEAKPKNIILGNNNIRHRAYKADYDNQHLHDDGATPSGTRRYYDSLTKRSVYFCEHCEAELYSSNEINSGLCVFCKDANVKNQPIDNIDFESEE